MLKSPWQQFYLKFPLIQDRLSWKTSILVRYKILGLFGKTLTSDPKYCRHYFRQISATCSSTIISKTKHIFWNFCCICTIYRKVRPCWRKNELRSLNISEVIDSEKCEYLNARKLLSFNTLWVSTCSRVLKLAEITMAALSS